MLLEWTNKHVSKFDDVINVTESGDFCDRLWPILENSGINNYDQKHFLRRLRKSVKKIKIYIPSEDLLIFPLF